MHRRQILTGGLSVAAIGALAWTLRPVSQPALAAGNFPYTLTDAQWRQKLTPAVYNILRQGGTEYPGTSPLLNEHRVGIFSCAGCDLPLFDSKTKYDSGTGWPSFYQPLQKAVDTSNDASFGMDRTEVHCSRCGGHLGHVFPDGPPPTGLRYCMDGLALKFVPAAA